MSIAKLDKDQFVVTGIDHYTGNCFDRKSLRFSVSFEDGTTLLLAYNKDLALSQQFQSYVNSTPTLLPLRFLTVRESKSALRSLNKLAITDYTAGDVIYFNLRFYDGDKNAWYDSLKLPSNAPHVVAGSVLRLLNGNMSVIVSIPTFQCEHELNPVDVLMYVAKQPAPGAVIVDKTWRTTHPLLFE